jgi:hypothetical protein
MKFLIKYSTFLLAVFFIVGFAPTLSAKGHRHHCSTSFSFNLLSLLPIAPVVPVYREYHYVERPTYYTYRSPRYHERTVVYERPYRETVIIERDPYYDWRY